MQQHTLRAFDFTFPIFLVVVVVERTVKEEILSVRPVSDASIRIGLNIRQFKEIRQVADTESTSEAHSYQ